MIFELEIDRRPLEGLTGQALLDGHRAQLAAVPEHCFGDRSPGAPFDPSAFSDTTLAIRAVSLEGEIASLEAERLAIAAELDDRHRDGEVHHVYTEMTSNPFWSPSAAKWLAASTRRNRYDTTRHVSDGKALRLVPVVNEAYGEGRLTSSHVRQILRVVRHDAEVAEASQAMMLEWALSMQWPQFKAAIDALIEVTDDTDPTDRAQRIAKRRGLWWTEFDGEVEGGFRSSTEQFEQWLAAIAPIAEQMFGDDKAELVAEQGPDAPLEQLARTSPQRLIDAATEALRIGAAARRGGAVDPGCSIELDIVMDQATFERELERWSTGSVPELLPEQAAAVAAEFQCYSRSTGLDWDPTIAFTAALAGRLRRIVLHADDAGVDVSVSERFYRGLKRKGIEIRDRWCATPGCGVPASQCHIDHVLPDSQGGVTSTENGEALCPSCHGWKSLLELLGFR
ncbi:MAG: HNH endonuclease [Acidimicrobiales bacterium]